MTFPLPGYVSSLQHHPGYSGVLVRYSGRPCPRHHLGICCPLLLSEPRWRARGGGGAAGHGHSSEVTGAASCHHSYSHGLLIIARRETCDMCVFPSTCKQSPGSENYSMIRMKWEKSSSLLRMGNYGKSVQEKQKKSWLQSKWSIITKTCIDTRLNEIGYFVWEGNTCLSSNTLNTQVRVWQWVPVIVEGGVEFRQFRADFDLLPLSYWHESSTAPLVPHTVWTPLSVVYNNIPTVLATMFVSR